MVIRIEQGMGGRDRDVKLSPQLLSVLRAYGRLARPPRWLFPRHDGERPIHPTTLSSTFRIFPEVIVSLGTRFFHSVGISRPLSNTETCINSKAAPNIRAVARPGSTCCHQGPPPGRGLPGQSRKMRKVELSSARSANCLTV